MPNNRINEANLLKHQVWTRLDEKTYENLQKLIRGNPAYDMSRLLRDIVCNRRIKVFTRDVTMDDTMGELARLRSEIRAIGVNINQITRFFNTYPEPHRKALYAKMAFKEYQAIEPKIEELLTIVSKLAKKWLSG